MSASLSLSKLMVPQLGLPVGDVEIEVVVHAIEHCKRRLEIYGMFTYVFDRLHPEITETPSTHSTSSARPEGDRRRPSFEVVFVRFRRHRMLRNEKPLQMDRFPMDRLGHFLEESLRDVLYRGIQSRALTERLVPWYRVLPELIVEIEDECDRGICEVVSLTSDFLTTPGNRVSTVGLSSGRHRQRGRQARTLQLTQRPAGIQADDQLGGG